MNCCSIAHSSAKEVKKKQVNNNVKNCFCYCSRLLGAGNLHESVSWDLVASKSIFILSSKIAVARNVREAPTENGLTAIWNSANETFIALNAAFLRVVDAGSNEELVEKVSNQFKTLANEVEANVNKLTEEVCNIHTAKIFGKKLSNNNFNNVCIVLSSTGQTVNW